MTRQDPKVRKASILDAALRMARLHGYRNMTRADIAIAAECSEGLVSSYFGTMTQLQRDVVRRAIKLPDLAILAQALVAKDLHVKKAPEQLLRAAAASIVIVM